MVRERGITELMCMDSRKQLHIAFSWYPIPKPLNPKLSGIGGLGPWARGLGGRVWHEDRGN